VLSAVERNEKSVFARAAIAAWRLSPEILNARPYA
jgi:hypothetical protein